MIIVKLNEAKLEYKRRTGKRLTNDDLAALSGVAESTLRAIATRPDYNTTLGTIDRICEALNVPLCDLLERRPNPKGRKKAKKKV